MYISLRKIDLLIDIQAIDIYTDMGRFTVAAKHHISIAEVYENETASMAKAISHYEQVFNFKIF